MAAPLKADHAVLLGERPGVVSPWTARSAAIAENAVPTSTARPSPRLAPVTVRATAAAAASPALIAIGRKWTVDGRSTSLPPTKWMIAAGSTAQAPSTPATGTTR